METTYEIRVKNGKDPERQLAVVGTLQYARSTARSRGGLIRIFSKRVSLGDGSPVIFRSDYYYNGEKISENVWKSIFRMLND